MYEPDDEATRHEKGRTSSPARARWRGASGNSLPFGTRSLQAKLVQSEVERGVFRTTFSSNVARVNEYERVASSRLDSLERTLASNPWRRVRPMFWKKMPVVPAGETEKMSSKTSVRYTLIPAVVPASGRERRPISKLRTRTGLSGGSGAAPACKPGQIAAGPAQVSSSRAGARKPSEYEA